MKNKRHLAKKLILPAVAILLLAFMAIGLFIYRDRLNSDLTDASCDTLGNVMEQQRFTFATRIGDQKSIMQTYADSFSSADELTESERLAKLQLIARNATFDFVSYATPDGETLENTGTHLNVTDRDYFKRALAGETVIADPMVSKVTGKNIITIATPVYTEGHITAVLLGIYDTENSAKLLMPSFNGKGYTYITTSDGEIIIKSTSDKSLALYSNLFVSLANIDVYALDDSETIHGNIITKQSGHSRYRHDGEKRLMHYSPVGINDWYIFSIAPASVIVPQSNSIMYNTTLFMLAVTLLSIAALAYFLIAQRQHLKELHTLAFVDSLTGASNRKYFKLTASEILSTSPSQYAFIILDIDKFKVLNDTLGYEYGDTVLIKIANILRLNMHDDEIFGRCDSDEYYVLLRYLDDKTILDRVLALISQIETQFKTQISDSYRLVLCAGIYIIPNPLESINSICDRARHAHRLIKGAEESAICFYDEDIRNRILEEKEIENKMHAALENNEFLLYLQPKYFLATECIYGAEALVRWKHGAHSLVFPDRFIPVFEKNGFITKLDMYMLDKACQTIREWLDLGITPIPVSINFSRLHLKNPFFVDDISAVVEKYQIPPALIEVELTESTMLHNETVLVDMLRQLHEHGLTLSMDDFGSGYSSLGLLKNLPVDVIKLDRTFFVDYCELTRAVTVVSGIISMAKNLGIKTVAEGVETKEQIDFLKELGCDIVQGYYYAKPMVAALLTQILRDATAPPTL